MALSSFLSDKNLARFRTKPCERLVAKGLCNFGDRCQYSHASRARRNPKKFKYSAVLCPMTCGLGDLCSMAHTEEERMYHPDWYKTRPCPSGEKCTEYYCPFAHSKEETRSGSSVQVGPVRPGAVTREEPVPAPEGWWFVGDLKDMMVSKDEVVHDFQGVGHHIAGGFVRAAKFLENGGQRECLARLLSTSRGDSVMANRVIKDMRRWMATERSPVLAIRRTVATTVLAFSKDLCCLEHLVRTGGVPQRLRSEWNMTSTVCKWLAQITTDLQKLHTMGIGHVCLGPSTILADAQGQLKLGDFLGKVQYLRYALGGLSIQDQEWAMWYPAEVHRRLCTGGALSVGVALETMEDLDELAIDSWQLGLVAFFMLTGEHAYGTSAREVCQNIVSHRLVNWHRMEDFPLWAHLIGRLLAHDPKDRLPVSGVLSHPLFWSFAEATLFARPWLEMEHWAWLYHIPSLAAMELTPPPAPPPSLLTEICDRALSGAKPQDLAQLALFLDRAVAERTQQQQQAAWQAFEVGALVGACEVYRQVAPPGLWPPAPYALEMPGACQDLTWPEPSEPVDIMEQFAVDFPGTESFFSPGFGPFSTPEPKASRSPRSSEKTACREAFKDTLGDLLHLLEKCGEGDDRRRTPDHAIPI